MMTGGQRQRAAATEVQVCGARKFHDILLTAAQRADDQASTHFVRHSGSRYGGARRRVLRKSRRSTIHGGAISERKGLRSAHPTPALETR
jgi:hypothetical protein